MAQVAGGLVALLGEWLRAGGGGGAGGESTALVASQRRLGVAADVDNLLADLDGMRALHGADRALMAAAEGVRSELRQLQAHVSY